MNRPVSFLSRGLFSALAASAAALVLLVPTALSDSATVNWMSPTPADQAAFSTGLGKRVSFSLTASTDPGGLVHIAPAAALPKGVSFNSSDGNTATASFSWTPEQAGNYTIRFTATLVGTTSVAPTLTYVVHVKGVSYPLTSLLTTDKVARWAQVLNRAVARAQPKASARAVTRLDTMTGDGTHNIVLILSSSQVSATQTWYRVRLPILPNNSTGWVPESALGEPYTVHTHLYVDLKHFRATLKKDGRAIFTTIVGVGRSIWPTPTGDFYIRDKLTNFNDPFYGPVAFGTSARSATLTDWPGGGFVGVHGTNQPEILPGRVSHGCIRMPNSSILKLARLMPVGTPLTIT